MSAISEIVALIKTYKLKVETQQALSTMCWKDDDWAGANCHSTAKACYEQVILDLEGCLDAG